MTWGQCGPLKSTQSRGSFSDTLHSIRVPIVKKRHCEEAICEAYRGTVSSCYKIESKIRFSNSKLRVIVNLYKRIVEEKSIFGLTIIWIFWIHALLIRKILPSNLSNLYNFIREFFLEWFHFLCVFFFLLPFLYFVSCKLEDCDVLHFINKFKQIQWHFFDKIEKYCF